MMRIAIAAAVFLSGCAATPAPPAEDSGSLLALHALDQRVAAVAWRLVTANAELCPDKAPLTGLTLHEAAQYGGGGRTEAVRLFALTDAPAVQTIAAGSPAEAAQLRLNDSITAVEGVDLRNTDPAAAPNDAHLTDVWSHIDAAAADGEVVLDVQRGEQRLRAVLRPVWGCAYRMQVRPSPTMNAWADGRTVTVSSALVRYLARDEDLALILGHEMAHNALRHPLAHSRAREREADRIGTYFVARAGYDLSGAADFWRQYGEDNWTARIGFLTHPGHTARSKAAADVAAEIEAQRAAGAPLLP